MSFYGGAVRAVECHKRWRCRAQCVSLSGCLWTGQLACRVGLDLYLFILVFPVQPAHRIFVAKQAGADPKQGLDVEALTGDKHGTHLNLPLILGFAWTGSTRFSNQWVKAVKLSQALGQLYAEGFADLDEHFHVLEAGISIADKKKCFASLFSLSLSDLCISASPGCFVRSTLGERFRQDLLAKKLSKNASKALAPRKEWDCHQTGGPRSDFGTFMYNES